jgi:hypothetical protein
MAKLYPTIQDVYSSHNHRGLGDSEDKDDGDKDGDDEDKDSGDGDSEDKDDGDKDGDDEDKDSGDGDDGGSGSGCSPGSMGIDDIVLIDADTHEPVSGLPLKNGCNNGMFLNACFNESSTKFNFEAKTFGQVNRVHLSISGPLKESRFECKSICCFSSILCVAVDSFLYRSQ